MYRRSGLVIAGARFALRCWLCSASADVVMRRVYGALLVAILVVCWLKEQYCKRKKLTGSCRVTPFQVQHIDTL